MNLRVPILLLTLFFAKVSFATTYYISNAGNTTNAGTSTTAPWSPAKFAASWASILPGDNILYKRGETFPPLVIGKSGTATARIFIGAYGTGNRPVFTKMVSLTSWTSLGNGKYEATVPAMTSRLNMVTLNGSPVAMGRYPNTGYLPIGAVSGNNFTITGLTSTPNWTGAEMVIRAEKWRIDRFKISAHSGSVLTVPTTWYRALGYGVFIQNDIDALDVLGEWFHAPGKLTMFFGANSPSSYQVAVSTADSILFSNGKSYVTVDNLAFVGANKVGIDVRSGSFFTVQNCDVDESGIDGVNATSHANFTIVNSTVTNSYNDGINMLYSGTINSTIRGNTVNRTYYDAGMGQSGNGEGAGIYARDGSVVEGNKVLNSGYVGIKFETANNLLIKNNYIDTFCFVKDDGGGIYAFGKPYTKRSNRILDGNIVLNGIGAPAGTGGTSSAAEGIYMDDETSDVEIKNNTIAFARRGLYLHNNQDIVVRGNTIYGNTEQAYLKDDALGAILRRVTFARNILFSRTAGQVVFSANSDLDDIASEFVRLDSNFYCRPINEPAAVTTSAGVNVTVAPKGASTSYYSLDKWLLKFTSFDKNTKKTAKTITSTSELRFEYATDLAKTIPLNNNTYIDHAGVAYKTNSLTLLPYTSKILLVTPGVPLDNGTNQSPAISLTSPISNQQYTSPASIALAATASDPDGTISKVDFYNGNTLLFSDNTSPYSYTWTGVTANNYNISAKATDNLGAVTASTTASITVNNPLSAPSVSLTSPANNATFTAPASIGITANATDADGTVKKVDFYNGTTLLFSDTSLPYAYTWTGVAVGTYSITAKATDNSGLTTTSGSVSVSVAAGNNPPTVTMTSPLSGTKLTAPASMTLTATASDVDGTISKVEFYSGNTMILTPKLTAPYSLSWTNVPAGNYSITAKAYDNAGAVTTSTPVLVSVSGAAYPKVSLSSPVNNAVYTAPANIVITATASDSDGTISSVKFYNGPTLLSTVTTAPYTYNWPAVTVGSYTITAVATDNSALTTTSAAVTITVNNPPSNIPPTLILTNPANSTQYTAPATVNIAAAASDPDGTVSKVDFYNGNTLLFSDATSPYAYTWSGVAAGSYSISAKATDNGGAVTASTTSVITVNAPPAYPTISLTSPINNSTYAAPASIAIAATASDPDGTITKVDFYNGVNLLSSDNTAPYSYNWQGVPAGTYYITAKVTDNSGLTTTSGISNVTVNAPVNTKPTVSITSPANNASITQPVNLAINASAADADGIKAVRFYADGVLLFSTSVAPYTYTYNSIPAGSYTLTAVAVDNLGDSTISAPVTVTINAQNVPPSATIIAPVNNAQYIAPATVNISVNALDNDGSVTSVKLYNGATLLTELLAEPFTFSWTNVAVGSYSLTAVATDNSGASTTSSPVSISVRSLVAPAVSITAPLNNATYLAPATVALTASASDPDGSISKVEFYRGVTLVSTDATSPYNATVSSLAAGTYAFTAKAYDNDNQVTTSSIVTVKVNAPQVAPTVAITSPANNAAFGDTVAVGITASASDADGTITKVDFYVGTTLMASDFTAPYAVSWTNMAAGTYAVTAKATDNSGLVTTSAPVTVKINHLNVAPTVSLISPANNTSLYKKEQTAIEAVANDVDGTISKVEFYYDNVLIGTSTTLPYKITWSTNNPGTYAITAKAYDNSGAVKTSNPITVNVVSRPIRIAGSAQVIVVP